MDGSSVPLFHRGITDHVYTQSGQFFNQILKCRASKYKFPTTQSPDGSMRTKSDPLNRVMWANSHIPPNIYMVYNLRTVSLQFTQANCIFFSIYIIIFTNHIIMPLPFCNTSLMCPSYGSDMTIIRA